MRKAIIIIVLWAICVTSIKAQKIEQVAKIDTYHKKRYYDLGTLENGIIIQHKPKNRRNKSGLNSGIVHSHFEYKATNIILTDGTVATIDRAIGYHYVIDEDKFYEIDIDNKNFFTLFMYDIKEGKIIKEVKSSYNIPTLIKKNHLKQFDFNINYSINGSPKIYDNKVYLTLQVSTYGKYFLVDVCFEIDNVDNFKMCIPEKYPDINDKESYENTGYNNEIDIWQNIGSYSGNSFYMKKASYKNPLGKTLDSALFYVASYSYDGKFIDTVKLSASPYSKGYELIKHKKTHSDVGALGTSAQLFFDHRNGCFYTYASVKSKASEYYFIIRKYDLTGKLLWFVNKRIKDTKMLDGLNEGKILEKSYKERNFLRFDAICSSPTFSMPEICSLLFNTDDGTEVRADQLDYSKFERARQQEVSSNGELKPQPDNPNLEMVIHCLDGTIFWVVPANVSEIFVYKLKKGE